MYIQYLYLSIYLLVYKFILIYIYIYVYTYEYLTISKRLFYGSASLYYCFTTFLLLIYYCFTTA